MVPAARLTDLDDVDGELGKFGRKRGKIAGPPHPPVRVGAEAVAVGVGDMRQLIPLADRAVRLGGLTVEAGGPEQVGVGVADVHRTHPATTKSGERGSAVKGVVDDRARLGRRRGPRTGYRHRHAAQRTPGPGYPRATMG